MKNVLTEGEWAEIREQSDEFGVIFASPEQDIWQPARVAKEPAVSDREKNLLELDTGRLTPGQVNSILTNVPIDITFVDENDRVAYFSQGKERIFTRTKSIIGRRVQNCHPPESVHMVEKIINDFKSGRHSTAQFWLELNGRFIHIRYVAIRDGEGKYTGTMEVSQDLTELRALKGERRLLQYSN
ncbi:MAG: PAS domain-containing protein [Desulfocucumaceae bacterium]